MNVFAFILYCIVVTITPGPTNIAILSIAHNSGVKKTFRFVFGVASAMCALLCASVVLNSLLAKIVPVVIPVMRVAGSVYMLYLAYKVLKMSASEGAVLQNAGFMTGFLMQFINPKAWMFIMTVIPGYVMPYYSSLGILLLFAALITIIAFLSISTWAVIGAAFQRFLQKYQKAVNIILSLLLVYSAIEVSGIVELIRG